MPNPASTRPARSTRRAAPPRSARPEKVVHLAGQLALALRVPAAPAVKVKRRRNPPAKRVETIPLELGGAAVHVDPPPKFIGPMPDYTATHQVIADDGSGAVSAPTTWRGPADGVAAAPAHHG
jgi:hypothetical protein